MTTSVIAEIVPFVYHNINHIPIDCQIKMLKLSSITNSTIMSDWQYRLCDLFTVVVS